MIRKLAHGNSDILGVMHKIKVLTLIIRDLFYSISIEYLPDNLFKLFYTSKLFHKTKKQQYKNPVFMRNKTLQNSSLIRRQQMLNNSFEALRDLSKNEDVMTIENLENNTSIIDSCFNPKKALIIVPDGWIDPLRVEGRTQGPQIQFLKKGLVQNRFETKIIQLRRDDPNLQVDIRNYQLIFIWSLTYFDPNSDAFKLLSQGSLQASEKFTVIGIITASPDTNLIEKYKEWTKILKKVLYYEEKSEFKKILDSIFEVTHIQLLQLTPEGFESNKNFNTGVHTSCLLKQNRIAWLIALRYICISLKINYSIRFISHVLSYKKVKTSYIPNEALDKERIKFGFGFVMVHRSHNVDANLIGSFWDYYKLGVIPLVQMQDVKEIASYMTPYLDYFPIQNDVDLYSILSISKSNFVHFNALKLRIMKRMESEFTPKNVVKNILDKFFY